jgi:hypothetical protein
MRAWTRDESVLEIDPGSVVVSEENRTSASSEDVEGR